MPANPFDDLYASDFVLTPLSADPITQLEHPEYREVWPVEPVPGGRTLDVAYTRIGGRALLFLAYRRERRGPTPTAPTAPISPRPRSAPPGT